MEIAKQANQQQKKVKERAAEAKRIKDLERQVHMHPEGQLSHSAAFILDIQYCTLGLLS